jgi:hypothetical protein
MLFILGVLVALIALVAFSKLAKDRARQPRCRGRAARVLESWLCWRRSLRSRRCSP